MTKTGTILTGDFSTGNLFAVGPHAQTWTWIGATITAGSGTVTAGKFQQWPLGGLDWDEFQRQNPCPYMPNLDPAQYIFRINTPDAKSGGYGKSWSGIHGGMPVTYGVCVGQSISVSPGSSTLPSPELINAMQKMAATWHQLAEKRQRLFTGVRTGSSDWILKYPWLREAQRFERAGRDDLALKRVYSTMGDSLRACERSGDFSACDEILRRARPDDLSAKLLLALLTTTLRYHEHLPSRAEFFEKVEHALRVRGEDTSGLLDGLG